MTSWLHHLDVNFSIIFNLFFSGSHYANTPMQVTAFLHNCLNDNFQMNNCHQGKISA